MTGERVQFRRDKFYARDCKKKLTNKKVDSED